MKDDDNVLNKLLIRAIEEGNVKKVKNLIKKKSDINANHSYLDALSYDNTFLHFAAELGNEKIVKVLIENGARIEARNLGKQTPLHCAAEKGHEKVVETILENEERINSGSASGYAYLYKTTQWLYRGIVNTLLQKKDLVDSEDAWGYTALHYAAMNKHAKTVETLIKKEANINTKNMFGQTPLRIAAICRHKEIVEILIAQGADVNIVDADGATVLHFEECSKHKEIVEALIENGINVNAVNKDNKNALHEAAEFGWKEAAEILVEKGIRVNAIDKEGNTPLHKAAEEGNDEIFGFLIRKGASIAARNNEGHTPLKIILNNKTLDWKAWIKMIQLVPQKNFQEGVASQFINKAIENFAEKESSTKKAEIMIFLALLDKAIPEGQQTVLETLVRNDHEQKLLQEALRLGFKPRKSDNNVFADEERLAAYKKDKFLNRSSHDYDRMDNERFSLKKHFNTTDDRFRHKAIARILSHPNAASALLSSRVERGGIKEDWKGKEAQDSKKPFFDASSLPLEIREYIVSFLIKGNGSVENKIFDNTIKDVTKKLSDYYSSSGYQYRNQASTWREREQEQRKKDNNKDRRLS